MLHENYSNEPEIIPRSAVVEIVPEVNLDNAKEQNQEFKPVISSQQFEALFVEEETANSLQAIRADKDIQPVQTFDEAITNLNKQSLTEDGLERIAQLINTY